MKSLITDKLKIVQYCRELKHEPVINVIMNSQELINFIAGKTKDKDLRQMIMHDTILNFIKNCLREDFSIKVSPLAYIKKIAHNQFLMYVRKKEKVSELLNDEVRDDSQEEYIDNAGLKESISQLWNLIDKNCKEVLWHWALKYKMSEIKLVMGYNSENYTKKKKHLCLKKLIAALESNPGLKNELAMYV